MGTYTTNYNLFMPTVGEQGWGTLVNGNFSTIDTTLNGLDTRLTAVESEVNGNLSCTSVTTSGKVTANGGVGTTSLTTSSTITSTGLITGNGGFKGNLTGNVTGNLYGKRVGVITSSKPYAWSLEATFNNTFSFQHANGGSQTSSKTSDYTPLRYWDLLENATASYSITITPTQFNYNVNSVTIKFTDLISGTVTTKTYTPNRNTVTDTVTAPVLVTVSVTINMASGGSASVITTIAVSRSTHYIKPKGT